MNTRFYAKRTADGPRAIPREVIRASISQTYNTNALSILSDTDQRSRNLEPTSHFTPVQVLVRSSRSTELPARSGPTMTAGTAVFEA